MPSPQDLFDPNIPHDEAYRGAGADPHGVQYLLKALEASEGVTDIADLKDVGALTLQSLETTLALLTHQSSHYTLWNDMPKTSAFSTLEEYSTQLGYGQEGGWVQQMETPVEGDPAAKREYAKIKFLRDLWKIADVATIVKVITGTEVWAKQAATMRLLRTANRTLYSGDSDLIPEQIDGFDKVISENGSADHVRDLRGAAPTQQDFRLMAQIIADNYGTVDGAALYCSTNGITTLDSVLENVGSGTAQRFLQGTVAADGGMSLGHSIKAIRTSQGTLIPKRDIFISGEYEGRGVPKRPSPANPAVLIEGKTSSRSPDTPAIAVTTQAATVAGSLWNDSASVRPSAKTYQYRVAAGNRFGLSAACAADDAGAVVVAAGSNTVTITPAATSVYPQTYYEIFSEQTEGDGNFRLVTRVADSGGATTAYVDLNEDIPGTTRMFLLDLTSVGEMRSAAIKRLAPLHSKEYARIGEYRWGSVNLYMTLVPYAPLRFAQLKNVAAGQASVSPLLLV